MRTPVIILLLASLLATSCEPPMPPTDEEMIRLFNTHEAVFDKIYEIIAESTEGEYYYPTFSFEEVITPDSEEESELSGGMKKEQDIPHGLKTNKRVQLDSLLAEIGCGFILVDRRERETADSINLGFTMVYYSHGIVDAGTCKCFVYDPELRSHRNIRITEHGDLNEIYRRTYNDTTLYKPIKGNWYIKLDHAR